MRSSRTLLSLLAGLVLAASPALAKDVPMKDHLFHYGVFSDVFGERQRFQPGFEGDDFHLQVSASKAVQRVKMVGDRWVVEHLPIKEWAAATNYVFTLRGEHAYILKNSWVYLVDVPRMTLIDEAPIRPFDRWMHSAKFFVADSVSGGAFVLMDYLTLDDGGAVELRRIHPDLTTDLVLEFPPGSQAMSLRDGFLVIPEGYKPTKTTAPFRAFHAEGKTYDGPLLHALLALRDSGLIAHEYNLWATSLRRPWVLVRNDAAPEGPSSRMWVMTLADAAGHPRTSPLVFETRQNVHERVQELLLSPTHDLFLAVVGNTKQASRSGTLWLGRIVRDGDIYRAVAYRVRSFDDIANMALSRDGSTLVFFSFRQGDWHVAGARMADILADINRRYPEAKLSLEALQAEMR